MVPQYVQNHRIEVDHRRPYAVDRLCLFRFSLWVVPTGQSGLLGLDVTKGPGPMNDRDLPFFRCHLLEDRCQWLEGLRPEGMDLVLVGDEGPTEFDDDPAHGDPPEMTHLSATSTTGSSVPPNSFTT